MSPPGLSQKSRLYRLGGFAAGNPCLVLAGWAVVIALVVGLWAAFGTQGQPVTADSELWNLPRYVCGWHWKSPEELEALLAGLG